jgi:uncharacterized protein (TIGR02301 family)
MVLVAMALAAPAIAAPGVRTPEQRQILLDLAYVLGQAHALHRVCAGAADDTWRGRMARMLEVETPGDAFKTDLTARFNAGFTARDAQARDCKSATVAEAAVARKGAALARRLGGAAP